MKNENGLDTILAVYTRGQRISRFISLAVTALTIIVGTSLVFVAAATTARYYAARNEINQLKLQIEDLKSRPNESTTPTPKNTHPTKSPNVVNPTPINNTNGEAQPSPCNKENQNGQPDQNQNLIDRLNENANSLQRRLDDCINKKPNSGVNRRLIPTTVKTPVVVQ
jgi:predicted membrane chloride channel (bestrophin family)